MVHFPVKVEVEMQGHHLQTAVMEVMVLEVALAVQSLSKQTQFQLGNMA